MRWAGFAAGLVACLASLAASAHVARAQSVPPVVMPAPPPPLAGSPRGDGVDPPADRLPRLRAVLHEVDAQARDSHLPVLFASLAVAGATIPTGIVLLGRDDEPGQEAASLAGPVLLGTGMGVALGGTLQLFTIRGATLELEDDLDAEVATGAPAGEVVSRMEARWAARAADRRDSRKVLSVIGMVVGAVAVGAGTIVGVAEPSGLTPDEQSVLAATLGAFGAATAMGSVASFFIETPEEVAWNTYAASNGLPRRPSTPRPELAVAPTKGGGFVGLRGAF